ncbi:hypothetical protein J4207_00295 [Candidatus Woesearchaeota archaeon]|nr:hypothetical protein [Candidatus Woesearchaeota archaeon]
MRIDDVSSLYPKSILMTLLLKTLAVTTRCLVHTKNQEKISEFRYVMD